MLAITKIATVPVSAQPHDSRMMLIILVVASLGSAVGRDPDVGKDMMQIVSEHGYPIEPHNITTSDGYILTAFRIPHGRAGPHKRPRYLFVGEPAFDLQPETTQPQARSPKAPRGL